MSKLIAFDLDGTLTQQKTPLEPANRAVLGTEALQADKLAFDPDRKKRRAIYDEVVATAVLLSEELEYSEENTEAIKCSILPPA